MTVGGRALLSVSAAGAHAALRDESHKALHLPRKGGHLKEKQVVFHNIESALSLSLATQNFKVDKVCVQSYHSLHFLHSIWSSDSFILSCPPTPLLLHPLSPSFPCVGKTFLACTLLSKSIG